MINEVLGWIMLGLSTLAVVLLLWSVYTWPRGGRHQCPGFRCSWKNGYGILGSLRRGRCWYNLTGLAQDEEGFIACPECGTRVRAKRLLREGRRFRWGRLGTATGLLAITVGTILWFRGSAWTSTLPSLPLVMLSQTKVGGHGSQVRIELDDRIGNGVLKGYAARLLAETVVTDLRDDDTRSNAGKAIGYLQKLWPHSKDILEQELVYGDGQSRAVVSDILRRLSAQPSEALIRACVHDLRDDSAEPGVYLREGNSGAAAVYLLRWQARARPYLIEALRSDDPQQRLLAAAVCAYAGYKGAINEAVPILLAHLRDNSIPNDCKLARSAIRNFGPVILPTLRAHAETTDEQAAFFIGCIIRDLEEAERIGWENSNPRSGPGWTYDPLGRRLESVARLFFVPSEYDIYPPP